MIALAALANVSVIERGVIRQYMVQYKKLPTAIVIRVAVAQEMSTHNRRNNKMGDRRTIL